jgi:hypothetical protein
VLQIVPPHYVILDFFAHMGRDGSLARQLVLVCENQCVHDVKNFAFAPLAASSCSLKSSAISAILVLANKPLSCVFMLKISKSLQTSVVEALPGN